MRCIMVGTKSTQSARMLLDQRERTLGVEARASATTRAAQRSCVPRRDEGPGVVERAGHERGAARLHPVLGRLGVDLRRRPCRRSAWPPGAAARGHGAHAARDHVGQRRVADARVRARSRPARSGGRSARRRGAPTTSAGLRGLDDRAPLGLGQPRRDRLRRRPEPPDREARLEELAAVRERDRDEVAFASRRAAA